MADRASQENIPDRMLVIVPSRGRPENIGRLVSQWSVSPDTDLLVAVDDDDPRLEEYRALRDSPGWDGSRMWLRVGLPCRLGPLISRVAFENSVHFRALGFMGDDHVPRTPGWDTMVLGALRRLGSGIVYGDDRLQGERLPTAAFVTSDVVRVLGWMALPGLVHLYVDNAWLELGRAAGFLRYLPEVVIEHMHPGAGKAPWDAGYAEANAPAVDATDRAVFEAWRETGLAADVERLRAAGVTR